VRDGAPREGEVLREGEAPAEPVAEEGARGRGGERETDVPAVLLSVSPSLGLYVLAAQGWVVQMVFP